MAVPGGNKKNPPFHDLPPRDPNHPWPPEWKLIYKVESGKPAFDFKAQHDPVEEQLYEFDLKDPYFGEPTDGEIWGWKNEEVHGQLKRLIALVQNMQETVKDVQVPGEFKAPAATDELLKSLQAAFEKADVVYNLPTPDDFREPEPDPPAGKSSEASGKGETRT